MGAAAKVEKLLQEAISLLEANGYPFTAARLAPCLSTIRRAPTAAARRRRVSELRELFENRSSIRDIQICRRECDAGAIRLVWSQDRSRVQARYDGILDELHEAVMERGLGGTKRHSTNGRIGTIQPSPDLAVESSAGSARS